MARITDDEIRILNRKITKIYEELWEETGNELFRISYEKTMRCGEVVKGRDGKGKHYNCHDPFCLRCNRRKKNENRKKTEYVLQNAKKKGMKYIHIILTKSNKEINELNVTEKAEEMKNEVFEFVKEMKKIDKRINIIASEEIEVKSGKFNPHWHLVMQINKRLPQKTIKKTWDKISDGGISVFGKNKIEDEWQEKTMSYYISKEKTDFKKDLNKDDLKLKIETLTEFYKGKKAKNGKWTGRQTLFFKGERFEKAIKDYNNPMTEETENDEMKQQMEQMKKQMEQMAEELKRMKQEREQERQAKAEAEALKQELEELKRSKKETETKAEAKAKAEKGERQEQGFLIIKDDDGNKVEVIEYKMRKGGGYCYISKDRTKAFTNSCYCTKYDNKGAFNIHEITEVMQSEGFERFSEQFGLEKIE